ncbi:hypothetical protein EJB05_50094 [Eragrostis curvula]|uniref:Amidase domain-containing protein n=1 Tax=Eragrostis curvula TaxID=38414 RepID=A0A5J9SZ44_9POAL|nr:hypothetical protein EJB05_50094 [Eragrostis curvula]
MAMAFDGGDYGAFMERFEMLPPQSHQHQQLPLRGLTFAIKDIFDISGRVTGFGNPDWARTHAPAATTSPVVLATLAAGATSVGKTVMDEMAYSINGENAHYGTPTNPCAPDRVPGGSSSGSAVSVAAKLVDFALGTDTGGSVRVPAAYCGIFGLRPSHGLVSVENVIPMSQMFDTVGWFARDLSTLSRVSNVLLPLPADETMKQPTQFIIPTDCFQILGSPNDNTYQILNASVAKKFGSHALDNRNLGEFISNSVPTVGKFISDFSKSEAPSVPALSVISYVMRSLQRSEFKANHGDWVNTVKPNLGPGIRERVHWAITSDDGPMEDFLALRTEFKSALADLVKDDGVLAIPTVPGSPPKLRMEASALENFRARAFSLLSIAGVSGFCQLSIPLGVREGIPVSISLVARHGADRFLLNVAQELYETLKEETKKAWGSGASSL